MLSNKRKVFLFNRKHFLELGEKIRAQNTPFPANQP